MATLVPLLTVSDAAAAIEFYKKALGAVELVRLPGPGGKRILHAALRIGDATFFVDDEFADVRGPDAAKAPRSLGGTSVTLHFQAPDVDATMAAAVAAGATVTLPVTDMFWGERYGRFRDPFGHLWTIATNARKVSPEEVMAGAKKAYPYSQGKSRD